MRFNTVRVPGQLRIEGRRIDAPALPLRAEVSNGYGTLGFQTTYVIFPTPGCWEHRRRERHLRDYGREDRRRAGLAARGSMSVEPPATTMTPRAIDVHAQGRLHFS